MTISVHYRQSFSKVLGTLAIFHEKSTYTVDISTKSIFSPPRLPNQCWFPNLNTLTHNMLCQVGHNIEKGARGNELFVKNEKFPQVSQHFWTWLSEHNNESDFKLCVSRPNFLKPNQHSECKYSYKAIMLDNSAQKFKTVNN